MQKGRRVSVEGRERGLPRGGAWLLAGLALLTIASLALFPFTERNAGFFVRAIHRYDTLELQRWAYQFDDNARSRYSPYLALGRAAPGATVVVADGDFGSDPTVDQRLYSFGGAERVIHIDASGADLLAGVDPGRFAMAWGPSGDHGPAWELCVHDVELGTVAPRDYVSYALSRDPVPSTSARLFLLAAVDLIDDGGRSVRGVALIDAELLPDGTLQAAGA